MTTGANAARVTVATRSCSASHRRAAPPAWARAGAAGSSPARTATSAASGGLNPRTDATSEAASGSSEDDSRAASACAPRMAGAGRSAGGTTYGRPGRTSRTEDLARGTDLRLPVMIPSSTRIRLLCRPMISATRSARPRSVSNVSVRMRSNGGCRTPASVADSSRLRSCWAKADGSPLALGEARWMRAQRGSIELRMVAVPDGPRTARATSSGAGCVTRTTRDPTSAVTSRATAASTTLSNDVTRRGILGSRYRRTSAYANAGLGTWDWGLDNPQRCLGKWSGVVASP